MRIWLCGFIINVAAMRTETQKIKRKEFQQSLKLDVFQPFLKVYSLGSYWGALIKADWLPEVWVTSPSCCLFCSQVIKIKTLSAISLRYARVFVVWWLESRCLMNHPEDGKDPSGCVGDLKWSIYNFLTLTKCREWLKYVPSSWKLIVLMGSLEFRVVSTNRFLQLMMVLGQLMS